MTWNRSRRLGRIRTIALAGVTGALTLSAGSDGRLQAHDADRRGRLEGAWVVQVTLRNCETSAPAGTFSSLVSFHEGGTVSEAANSPAFAIGQRTPGHGTWTPIRHHQYRQRVVNLIAFDTPANLPGTPTFDPARPVTPGFFAGWQIVTHTVALTGAGRATSAGTNAFYRTDGTLYRSGCSTADLQRFE